MTRYCDNCGRSIGRIDSETFDGRIVCLRCAKKLKVEAGGGEAAAQAKRAWQMIIAAIVSAIVSGGIILAMNWLVDNMIE